MSEGHISSDLETLFSFELLVEHIRIEEEENVSDELALAVRLLDFPTLLIYQSELRGDEMTPQNGKRGKRTFNRGKCCFFKMNLSSLHTQLSNSPLYAMLLDVKEEVPKLIGTSLFSLAKVMDRIRQDVAHRGVFTPSSHGERGLVGLSDLSGETIGSISLSYKLLSLGASLLPHITDGRGIKRTTVHTGQNAQESIKERDLTINSPPSDCEKVRSEVRNPPSVNQDKQDVSVAAQIEHELKRPQTDTESSSDEDLTVFRPPHLYYSNSGEETKSKNEDYTFQSQDMEAFTFEDSASEEERSPATDQRSRRHGTKTSADREQTSAEAATAPREEALRHLPLLNALLVELSLLNGQNQHRVWSGSRPASTEPSHAKPKNLTQLHSPRHCSTPISRSVSAGRPTNSHKQALVGSCRKQLVYGTTKTFNLRLKLVSSAAVKRRECMELTQNETQTRGKVNCRHKIMKSSKRKSELTQSFGLDRNIQTVIQSITEDPITPKHKNMPGNKSVGKVHRKQDGESPMTPESSSCSDRDVKRVHVPGTEDKDDTERLSEPNRSQSDSDRQKMNSPSSSSGEGSEGADYADDFNSLEPSDTCSPDPASSPEPAARARTPRSPVRLLDLHHSDSGSEPARRRVAVLPVPVRARGSPQRALSHTPRPRRTLASTFSASSDEAEGDGSAASTRATSSRKQAAGSSEVERGSGAESIRSSRGQRSEATWRSGTIRGFSEESVSSFEPQEADELKDELGSLDFRKEYQHISELVANKLPGYTM